MADKFVKVDNPSTADVPNIQLGSALGGVTKIESTNSASNYTATLPAKSGTVAFIDDLNTSTVAETGNLYFTNARAIGATLTGFTAGSNVAITSADSILAGLQKAQGQINARATRASPTFTGTATFSVINATSTITGNTIAVNAGGAGSTTITRASSATSYTATLPAKTGTIAFLDDISGGGANYQLVTVTSTQSITSPSWATRARVTLVGGGGGGGGSNTNGPVGGSGGGGGQIVQRTITVAGSTPYTVTIGAGGNGGNFNSNGSNGGNSTFASLLTATGGGGGRAGNNTTTDATLYSGAYGGGVHYAKRDENSDGTRREPFGCGGLTGGSVAPTRGGNAFGTGGTATADNRDGGGGGGSYGNGSNGQSVGGGGLNAADNTGGGGGGAAADAARTGLNGGSGICIVEWLP